MQDWIRARIDGGVLAEHTSTERMRIRLCNRIALTDLLNMFIVPLLVGLFTGLWGWALALAAMMIPNILPLWLNPRGYYSLARASSIVAGCIWLPIIAYLLGEACRVEIGLVIVLVGVMITVPKSDPLRGMLIVLPFVSAIALFLVREIVPWPGAVAPEYHNLVFLICIILCAYNVADRIHTMNVSADERDAELNAANAAKSAFLTHISHELRTPLAGVIGLTALALDPGDGDDPQALLEESQRSAQHLMKILNGLLDLAKIEAGAMELEVIDFDLDEVVHEAVVLIRPRAQEKGLTVRLSSDLPSPCWRRGDPLRIKQILINLLSNAVKFTPTGEVSLSARLNDDNVAELVVADTGIGMTAEQAEEVFAPFQQAESSTSRRYGGTGMGLTISQQLTVLSGGTLRCDSAPGAGSRFEVILPLPPGEPQEEEATQQAADLLPGMKILVAEDNAVNQLVIEKMLTRLGQETTIVPDGAQAVSACEGVVWDLILMDMQMPVLDGIGATKALRASGYTGPIWALTANAMREELDRCLAAGMDEVLTKPIDLPTLCRALARLGDTGEPLPIEKPETIVQDVASDRLAR